MPANNMSLEEADGFLTALAAGPVRVPPAEYLPRILRADGETAGLDTPRHHALAMELLTRHHDAIERDLAAGIPPIPWLENTSSEFRAVQWALGYVTGIELRKPDWARLSREQADRRETADAGGGAAGPPEAGWGRHRPAAATANAADRHPAGGRAGDAAMYWDGGMHSLLEGPSHRTPKTGRNDPCPCGSGKKYKRCCGAAA